MTDPPQAVAEMMKALSADYLRVLPEKIDTMEALWVRANAAADTEALAEVERMAHSLHGGAATFGLAVVGAAAGRLESAIRALRDASPEAAPVLRAPVALALAQLRQAFASG